MNDSMNILNPREREILTARRLSEDIATLEDLSKKYKISRERIRQIETKAFEKLQKAMLNAAKSNNLLPKINFQKDFPKELCLLFQDSLKYLKF